MTLRLLPSARRLPLALAALAVVVAGVPPAAAHGRQVLISLEAAADGGTAEVTAVVSFRDDGHAVSGAVLETTAVSGSEQVGVELAPAGEPGTYSGTAELAPGTWEITTAATGDHTGTAVTELTVAEPAPTTTTPPPTTSAPAPAAADPAEPAAAGASGNPLLVVVPVALVALGAAVLVWRRLRRA